ncbi:DUF2891 domain-containing protein [Microlunatus spumicola]|uniref:DUF2891 domain-containing protein n=1 Tax=Microlunatus spumicola TaxID=81499 RepID=A0ABP6WVJ5_9ACTN
MDLGRLVRTAVTNATRAYPYALITVVDGPEDLRLPAEQHPAFSGCYDWHSAVHTHWLLVRLLRRHAGELEPEAAEAALAVLGTHLTPANLTAEAAFLARHSSFERPYGWAWLVALAAECTTAAAEGLEPAREWAAALAPAADVVVGLVLDWLPRAGRPVRDGTHASTAFALGLLLDAAATLGRDDLDAAVRAYVRERFVPDRDAPLSWEPSGQDFLSPGLSEADLVRRVLAPGLFGDWLEAFWPGLATAEPRNLLDPVEVRDRTDGQLGHLDGLNLSRSAALAHLAAALAEADPRRSVLETAAAHHLDAGLGALAEEGYQSTHWLGTFALLALEPAG